MNYYLISLDGPEWNYPKEICKTKAGAERRCAKLNEELRKKKNPDMMEQISCHYVHAVKFNDA